MKGDTFYLIWAGVLVFFMQCGFAMIESGSIRSKNTKNILIKNLLDACLGGFFWYLFGYGVALGEGGYFFGQTASGYAIHDPDWFPSYASEGNNWALWFFQFTFAATSVTIVSGAVAERCQLFAYLIYSIMLISLVYPVVVHMVWSSDGLISAFNTLPDDQASIFGGAVDFAGSGVVHMTGGISALIGAVTLGPRIGR
jgi:Amt family ammonium transporter